MLSFFTGVQIKDFQAMNLLAKYNFYFCKGLESEKDFIFCY